MLLRAVFLLILITWNSAAHARREPADAGSFVRDADAWVEAALGRVAGLPGLAVAVVVDDAIVLSRGYGQADVENRVRSTGQTLYYIASATKPYTALLATLLDREGRIDLDSSLRDHLVGSGIDLDLVGPGVTLRDLLSHQSGLENPPVTTRLAFTGEHDPELLWRLLSATKANATGAGTYDYTNFGYNLLTLIVERELNQTWQELLREEVFEPAGLERTTAYASLPVAEGWPVAAPYFGLHPDGLWRVPLVKVDATMQSAGGVLTTPDDAARWMLLQLNDGAIDGRQVFDPAIVRETRQSRVDVQQPDHGPFGTTGCGLGWQIGSYADDEVVHHAGGYPGFRSWISFMPDQKIAVSVFVNEGSVGGVVGESLLTWCYDWWLGREQADVASSVERMVSVVDRLATRIAESQAGRSDRTWMLRHARTEYAGEYVSADYGVLEVAESGQDLMVRIGQLHGAAEPFPRADAIRVELVPGQGQVIQFIVEESGLVTGLDYEGTRFARR